ncbi:hypothetical protein GCM10011369_00630 [Neiella marina]|uniref:Periplasmic binding protein domain-containing protein n=1 Tax=Neiella marina TaxID=508461 RepID=A0A8J2XM96_9GAMM|nr:ABC transporter substrate-binding protein [Neiella marina]GGA63199.1 hypothetical protein GCM10011369_00630 [Neiella marina]
MHAVLINPAKPGNVFWDNVSLIATTAAESLGIELTIKYAQHRFGVIDHIRAIANQPSKPDYVIFMYQKAHGLEALKILEQAKINSFLINTDIPEQEQPHVGKPRQYFKHWLGHSFPNNQQAGYQLSQWLLARAQQLELAPQLVAISGSRESSASAYCNQGLRESLQSEPMATLHQLVFAHWSYDKAKKQAKGLLARYPETNIVWAMGEDVAFGIIDAARETGRNVGNDLLIGSTVSTAAGLNAIQNGLMVGNIGPDIWEAGWALSLLADHFHGYDFGQQQTVFEYQLQLVTADNLQDFAHFIDQQFWQRFDFKSLTKRHNTSHQQYQLSAIELLRSERPLSYR